MIGDLRPLVAGVAHGFDRGIDGGLAAELEEGGVERKRRRFWWWSVAIVCQEVGSVKPKRAAAW
ncbi:MAG: hypothetical protein EAZ61_11935 [Oscillatoriales cyanobacterium]|nr:MAG: hypothetical protein EAZ61_11935 [Oscillatoriales cyanobacterium]